MACRAHSPVSRPLLVQRYTFMPAVYMFAVQCRDTTEGRPVDTERPRIGSTWSQAASVRYRMSITLMAAVNAPACSRQK